jgi:hypothetical protein
MKVIIGDYKDDDSQREISINIDPWDTYSMDHTLALIISPMLKQLREKTHGAPLVEDEDVPENLKSTSAPPKKNEWDTDANHFNRWDWVLSEMIFAFDNTIDDSWQDQFFPVIEDDDEESFQVKALDFTVPKEYYDYCDRIQNGFRLFGKYYSHLWD